MASDPIELVPDSVVKRELGVSLMTLWRWSHDPKLKFPRAKKIRERNYRDRRELEAWKRGRIAAR